MKIQNWTRWHQESDQAHDIIREFSRVCEKSRGYAYEAGWLSSAYLRVIMCLPRAQREQELKFLEDETKRLKDERLIATLKQGEAV